MIDCAKEEASLEDMRKAAFWKVKPICTSVCRRDLGSLHLGAHMRACVQTCVCVCTHACARACRCVSVYLRVCGSAVDFVADDKRAHTCSAALIQGLVLGL